MAEQTDFLIIGGGIAGASVGYWLAPPAWGKGFCSEAGAAVIRWLEATRNARALVAGHFADNPASGRVLEKSGFLYTGETRRAWSRARRAEIETRMMVWLA